MKTDRIRRNKTQQKQKSINLPELAQLRKIATIKTQSIKADRYMNKNDIPKRQNGVKKLSFLKQYLHINSDDSIMHLRNAVKLSRKRTFNDYICIKQLNPLSDATKTLDGNIVNYQADQYQGQRPYNQDRICCVPKLVINNKIYAFFAVFDGHGGSSVSELLRIHLVKAFQRNLLYDPESRIENILKKSICDMQQKVIQLYKSKTFDGGSCVSALVISQNKFYIAHLGDCRILKVELNQNDEQGQVQQLTRDHKPEDEFERRRIQEEGGRVYRQKTYNEEDTLINPPYRVYPGRLSVTRTIGDLKIKNQPNGGVISSVPNIIGGQLGNKSLFLLFTDGVIQKFSNSEIISYFKTDDPKFSLRRSLQTLLMNSIMREANDNISVISILSKKY